MAITLGADEFASPIVKSKTLEVLGVLRGQLKKMKEVGEPCPREQEQERLSDHRHPPSCAFSPHALASLSSDRTFLAPLSGSPCTISAGAHLAS